MEAGHVHFHQDVNMVASLWKNKQAVAILSTNAQAEFGKAKRNAPVGKKVKIPKPVLNYNLSMGSIDLADKHQAYYMAPSCSHGERLHHVDEVTATSP